jgi:signal transduction histidine kinase
VRVNICLEGGDVILEVVDDGQGFAPQAASDAGGIGLVSMQERAEKLGCTLTISSAPGTGTKVMLKCIAETTDYTDFTERKSV